ncbi:hypothetical protein V8E36_008778, partial [Tilletia maclaganii]
MASYPRPWGRKRAIHVLQAEERGRRQQRHPPRKHDRTSQKHDYSPIALALMPRNVSSSSGGASRALPNSPGRGTSNSRAAAGGGARGARRTRAVPAATQAAAGTVVRWTRSQEERLAEWLCRRDASGIAKNFAILKGGRKTEASQKCIKQLKLLQEEPQLTERKVADKFTKMVDRYKDVVKELDQSGGGVGAEDDERPYKGQGARAGDTIQSYIHRTCHWYYEFDAVMGERTNIR